MKMISHLAQACFVALCLSTAFTQSHADITNQSAVKKSSKRKSSSEQIPVDTAPPESLRTQATLENNVSDDQKRNSITDAHVESGMLSLKDPRLEVTPRKFKYYAQLSAQQFHPAGNVRSDLNFNFDLGQNSTTLMPSLNLGVLVPFVQNDSVKMQIGLAGKFAYASQNSSVVFPSGYVEDDARLNTMILAVNPYLSVTAERLNWLSYNLGLEYGDVSYTQTSSNDRASFSKRGGYKGWNVGLNFQVAPTWAITTNYAHRQLNDDSGIDLQSNNYELGTQITW